MPDMSFLMILVIALAAGLVASMSVANHMQSAGSDFYRSYLTNILLFNLLILSGMVFTFMLQGQVDVGFLLPLLLVLMALVLISLLHGWLTGYQDESDRVLINGTLLMLFNVFPVWWIRYYRPAEDLALVEKLERYGISPRERQIVELIALGKTNQAIADELFISLATVKDHNHRIFSKCGVKNRTELARLFS